MPRRSCSPSESAGRAAAPPGDAGGQQEEYSLAAFSRRNAGAVIGAIAGEFKSVVNARAKAGKPWAVQIARSPELYLRHEAWQYLGQRVGIIARTAWVRPVESGGTVIGWHARAEVVRVATGDVVGAAEQVVFADEAVRRPDGTIHMRWVGGDGKPMHHAMVGMAQTRASSRALAGVLRFLAELSGFASTPAEEMEAAAEPPPAPAPSGRPAEEERETEPPPADDGRMEGALKRIWAAWHAAVRRFAPGKAGDRAWNDAAIHRVVSRAYHRRSLREMSADEMENFHQLLSTEPWRIPWDKLIGTEEDHHA